MPPSPQYRLAGKIQQTDDLRVCYYKGSTQETGKSLKVIVQVPNPRVLLRSCARLFLGHGPGSEPEPSTTLNIALIGIYLFILPFWDRDII